MRVTNLINEAVQDGHIVRLTSDTIVSKLKLEKLSRVGPVMTSDVDDSISIISL